MLEFSHKPVMLEECMEGLNLKADGIYFDGTVGGGGGMTLRYGQLQELIR